MLLVLALLIGIVAGLRAMTAPAAVSWAGYAGWLPLAGTPLSFMGWWWVPWLLTVLALGEFITDQLPGTPSRKVPMQFAARVVTGALSGATIATGIGLAAGVAAGAVGAVIGTFGGAILRSRLAAFFRADRPAALIEDAIAIIVALLIVSVA